jgi:hypothetical protein
MDKKLQSVLCPLLSVIPYTKRKKTLNIQYKFDKVVKRTRRMMIKYKYHLEVPKKYMVNVFFFLKWGGSEECPSVGACLLVLAYYAPLGKALIP